MEKGLLELGHVGCTGDQGSMCETRRRREPGSTGNNMCKDKLDKAKKQRAQAMTIECCILGEGPRGEMVFWLET